MSPLPPARFEEVVGERWPEVRAAIEVARELFAGRVIWHVNSTARGGGVAELLQSLLAYARGTGVDNRWIVIDGNPDFFAVTKRVHNHLHGSPGDGGKLGPAEREVYEAVTSRSASELARLIRPGDVVFLHDPQTAGMTHELRETGAHIVWRCHVGIDIPNGWAKSAWDFIRPYAQEADSYVFSRKEFVWEGLEGRKVWVVAPSIDAFSPKNQHLDDETVSAILHTAGLRDRDGGAPLFVRVDGSPGRVDSPADIAEDAPIPAEAPVLTQVSRWDRLKDPAGVMRCFAEHCDDPDLHLLLAGPATEAVSDDPEGAEVLAEVLEMRDALDAGVRGRVHLACLPMRDIEENAAIVNAIQRRSTVVMQKSIAEGFGLTVSEAMWKALPVVATRCGGIQDQIVDGESGILVSDPLDLAGFGAAVNGLVDDSARAEAIGLSARERVRENFLGTRHLIQYMHLLAELIGGAPWPKPIL